jgi:hypothetical protein
MSAGCGRLAFDEHQPEQAVGDATQMPDACTYSAFSAPVRLAGPINSAIDDWGPHPALGDTQLFFCSYISPALGECDLFYATRADPSSQFSAPIHISELASTSYDGGPTVTDDGLDMIFYRTGLGLSYDLMESTRNAITDPWGTPVSLAFNTGNTEQFPAITASGLRMVFASSRTGSIGAEDVWEVTRASRADPWGAPTHLPELATPQNDGAPAISSNGLEIFFVSDRGGGPGMLDVFTARRSSVTEPFSTPVLVPEVSSTQDEDGLSLSADGLRLYLNYDALSSGGGNADFWVATRTCD